MKENMMWTFFIYLSKHMWNEPSSPPKYEYLPSYDEYNRTDPDTWDEIVRFIAERKYNTVIIDVGDGLKFESHPEISAPDAWDKDFLKKKLDEMRALGLEPIPKLNFSACHSAWLKEYRRMISTPIYYRVCSDLIREVCEVFGYPRFFHLGLDEESFGNQRLLPVVTIRQGDLWWHDLSFLFNECEKHGARPWIWSDYYWHNKEDFEKNMPRSVLQSNWYYDRIKDYNLPKNANKRTMIETYVRLGELGFEQVPTSSTCVIASGKNSLQTLAYCKERVDPDSIKGFMTVPWFETEPDLEFAIKNDAHALYRGRKMFYPETL